MANPVKDVNSDKEARISKINEELSNLKHEIDTKYVPAAENLGTVLSDYEAFKTAQNKFTELQSRGVSFYSEEWKENVRKRDAALLRLKQIGKDYSDNPTVNSPLYNQMIKDMNSVSENKKVADATLATAMNRQAELEQEKQSLEKEINPPQGEQGNPQPNPSDNPPQAEQGTPSANPTDDTQSDTDKTVSNSDRENLINSAASQSRNSLLSLASDSSLGIDINSIEPPMLANQATDKEKLDKMLAENEKSDGKKIYYAKDISPEKDGSAISVVRIDKDKEKDHEKTEQALKTQGYEKLENKDGNISTKFVEKYEANKETQGVSKATSEEDSAQDAGQNEKPGGETATTELSYNDKKKKLEDEGIKEYNKDAKLTIAGHNVPYVKVNGSNKIRFPKYDKVMGLPPLRIFTNDPKKPSSNIGNNTSDLFDVNIDASDSKDIKLAKEYFLYNVDEMLVNSFPILTIRPLDCENLMGTNGNITKDKKTHDDMKRDRRYNIVDNIVYKFAVTTTNSINYSHQNNFAQSSTESSGLVSSLNGMGKFTSDLVGIGQNTAGFGHNNLIKDLTSMGLNLGGDIDEAVRQFIAAGEEGSKGLGAVGSKMGKTVADIANLVTSVVGGGRIDFPDVWQDSQTSFQQSFTIELRSLNPDPTSDQYFYDIILPLYILLTISLPTEGNVFSYKTPPLITCSLDDSFMEILLGAVTQINWSFDTKEINFKKVPWHCQVNITIRDLYSVMSQATYTTKNEKYVKDSNREIMTKEKYFENFIRTKDKKIPNEKYYLTEFAKIPAYMNALEQRMNKEQKVADEEKMKNSVNGGDKSSSQQPEGNVSGNSGETGKDTSNAPKKEEIKTDPKTGKKTLISSIGGFVTGITKGIRNVVASVNKVITPVRQIINTGATVLNAANNVKCAIKCVGQTANLPGLLNGSFAASVGLAFENLGKAGNVLNGLSGGVLGSVTKSVGGICTTLSELGRSALVLDLPEYVSKDGKTIQLNDPFKVASSTMRATGLMVSNILNTVQGAKMIGNITKSSDPLATLTTYVNAANKIVGEVDFTDRLLNVAKGSAIETGQYTAGQLASNATIQERFRHVANTVSGQAASVASTMFNTTLAEYMMQQQWFNTYFQSTNNNADPSNPVNIKDFKYKDEIKAAIDYANGKTDSVITPEVSWNAVKDAVMDNIDGSIQDFSKGVKEFANTTGDILIKSGFSGVVNTAGTPFDVIFMENK